MHSINKHFESKHPSIDRLSDHNKCSFRTSFTPRVRKQIWVLNARLPIHILCVSMQLLGPLCVCANALLYVCVCRTCDEGWTSPGQRNEWTRQISQRLKALLPDGGNGQALMLMWTNKRKPKWVEWTIICCGEALPWNWACLLCFQSGGLRRGIEEHGERERGECVWERKTHTKRLGERGG